jgi:hypothetical protein
MSNTRNHDLSPETVGSSFESFLEEAGIAEEVNAVAIERVNAWLAEKRLRTLLEEKEPSR